MQTLEILLPDGRVPTWHDAEVLNIGVGVVPELRVRAMLGDQRDGGLPIVHLHLRFHFSEARYVAEFVGLQGPDVSSVDLRGIRVAELIRVGAAGGIFLNGEDDSPPASLREIYGYEGEPRWSAEGMAELSTSRGPSEKLLAEVALSYQIAQISSQPPAKAVERQFGLPARTAARWISKAKALGLLDRPAVPGWEDLTKMSDLIRDKIERGEKLVHEVTVEDLDQMRGGH